MREGIDRMDGVGDEVDWFEEDDVVSRVDWLDEWKVSVSNLEEIKKN